MIAFLVNEISFVLKNKKRNSAWLEGIVLAENKKVGTLTYIFCSDEYLLEMNRKHLSHDYYTDVITFDYCQENEISGDIFISVDRVKENAKNLGINFDEELKRVMAHGLLHLLGYGDKSRSEQKEMRAKEDFYLALLN